MSTELKDIPPRQVYEWVKCGHWNLKQFEKWVSENDKRKVDCLTQGVPLGGVAKPDSSKCCIENDGSECGCAFGQCKKGLIF